MRTKQRDEETEFDNAFDANGRLRDGVTRIKVPIKMMDSASVRDGKSISHPGFTTRDATQRDRHAIYDAYDLAASQAWRGKDANNKHCANCGESSELDANYCSDCGEEFSDGVDDASASEAWKAPPTGQGSHGQRGQQAGDLCTIDGSPGHFRSVGGSLKCVPDKGRADATDKVTQMEGLYRARDTELADQWRRAK